MADIWEYPPAIIDRETFELVLEDMPRYVQSYEKLFAEKRRELDKAQKRIREIDSIIQKLYEDNLDGKISDERFARMTATYEQEQKELEARVLNLPDIISKAKVQRLNIDSFLAQLNYPANRKNRHSWIAPNYADIFS